MRTVPSLMAPITNKPVNRLGDTETNLSTMLRHSYVSFPHKVVRIGLFAVLYELASAFALRPVLAQVPSEAITVQPTPAPAAAQRPRRRFPLIGPEVEVSYLMNPRTRARFGSTLVSYSLGFGDITPPLTGGFDLDFSLSQQSREQAGERNRFLFLAAGLQYTHAYLSPGNRHALAERANAAQDCTQPAAFPRRILPYYGISLDAVYADVGLPNDRVHGGGAGVGGSIFLGIALSHRAYIETRFRTARRIKGFDFSQSGLTLGLRF